MTILEKVDLKRIPDAGYVIAYFRSELMFFFGVSGVREELQKREMETLLELHIFDAYREYRLIHMQNGKWIEAVISDETETLFENGSTVPKDKKTECLQVEEKYAHIMKYLKVVNYIDYDENGMISISNYRLASVERDGNNWLDGV